MSDKKAVVALGGNAIIKSGQIGTIEQQFANTKESLSGIVDLINEGYKILITHGNGPQVGNYLVRVETSCNIVPEISLGMCVAGTQGEMGYMIEQSLQNRLKVENIDRRVSTLLTQVVVDKDDPSMTDPSKFVGMFYSRDNVKSLENERGWIMKEDKGRGYRRVVPSPHPIDIVESEVIERLLNEGVIVIVCGGGGIPVYINDDGLLRGIDAVIDKDRASALLGKKVGAHLFVMLTDTDYVYTNYNEPDMQKIERMTVEKARILHKEGHFPPGSMGPKIEASIDFLMNGGEAAIITTPENIVDALDEKTGTWIVKNDN
jgi:carbamate kinase